MIGTVEIFELSTTKLVYSDGLAPRVPARQPDVHARYLVVRRLGPHTVPCAKIIALIFDEFIDWHLNDINYSPDISPGDLQFLINPHN